MTCLLGEFGALGSLSATSQLFVRILLGGLLTHGVDANIPGRVVFGVLRV